MNVCIITSWFPNRKHPNIAPFVYNFAKNLGKSGVNVSVIAPIEDDDAVSKQDYITIYRIKPRQFPLFSMLKLLQHIQPDIIHVHAPNWFSSNAIIASKLRKIPVIATVYRGEIDVIDEPIMKPLPKNFIHVKKIYLK